MTAQEHAERITAGWVAVQVECPTVNPSAGDVATRRILLGGDMAEAVRLAIVSAIETEVACERERCAEIADGWKDTKAGQDIAEQIRNVR